MSDKIIQNPILGAPYRILWPVADSDCTQPAPQAGTYRLVPSQYREWAVYNGDFILGIYTSESNTHPDSRGRINLTLVRDPALANMRWKS